MQTFFLNGSMSQPSWAPAQYRFSLLGIPLHSPRAYGNDRHISSVMIFDDDAGMAGARLELHLARDRNGQFAMFRIVRQDPNLAVDLAGLHSFKDRLYIQAELPIFAALWGARDAKKRHIGSHRLDFQRARAVRENSGLGEERYKLRLARQLFQTEGT